MYHGNTNLLLFFLINNLCCTHQQTVNIIHNNLRYTTEGFLILFIHFVVLMMKVDFFGKYIIFNPWNHTKTYTFKTDRNQRNPWFALHSWRQAKLDFKTFSFNTFNTSRTFKSIPPWNVSKCLISVFRRLESVATSVFFGKFFDTFKTFDIFNFIDIFMYLNLSVWYLLQFPMISGFWRHTGW